LLGIEGVIIGAAVLTTAGLRSAILAYATTIKAHPAHFSHVAVPTFPSSDVLVYGGAFSLILAVLGRRSMSNSVWSMQRLPMSRDQSSGMSS